MNAELLDFTRRALAAGIARNEIARVLGEANWRQAEIAAALNAFAEVNFAIPIPKPKPYLSPWEVFAYLVLFVALYAAAYSLASMIFDFINLAFPDPLQSRVPKTATYDSIRWHIASLAVELPLFLFMFVVVNREIAADAARRASAPRKWLTYLTLFVAAMCLAGDLVTLVYNLLGGEFTIRFLLKVLTVAVVTGGILAYFLVDIRRDDTA